MTTPTPGLPEAEKAPEHRSLYELSGCIADINTLLVGRNELRRLSDAAALLASKDAEIERLRADAERLAWLDKNPGRIKHSTGYRGAPDSWAWTDASGYGHDAANLSAAIDSALAAQGGGAHD